MTRYVAIATAVFVGALFSSSAGAGQGTDPLVGTWRLNVGKSTYSPGPMPKTATTTIEAVGKGYRFSVRQELGSGPALQWSYTTSADGTDSPVTGNNPNADVVAVKRVSATTLETVNKKGGKTTVTNTMVVSADGKTRTVTTKGTDAQGRTVSNVGVYEKQ